MFGSESSIQPRGLELVPEHPLRRHCLLWRPALRRCCREERCRHCGSEPPSTGWHRDCIWRRGWVPRESRGRWTRAPSQGHSRWKPGCLFVALLVLALPLLLNSAGIPGAPPPACSAGFKARAGWLAYDTVAAVEGDLGVFDNLGEENAGTAPSLRVCACGDGVCTRDRSEFRALRLNLESDILQGLSMADSVLGNFIEPLSGIGVHWQTTHSVFTAQPTDNDQSGKG